MSMHAPLISVKPGPQAVQTAELPEVQVPAVQLLGRVQAAQTIPSKKVPATHAQVRPSGLLPAVGGESVQVPALVHGKSVQALMSTQVLPNRV